MTNRREFLQATAAITGASLLPKNLFATPTFHFIQTTKLNFWLIDNPTQWCLDHKHDPVLELRSSPWSYSYQVEQSIAWEGLEDGQLPWEALKSTWQP